MLAPRAFLRGVVRLSLSALAATSALQAQTPIVFTYTNGQTGSSSFLPSQPYELTIASGAATESGQFAGAATITKTGAGTLTLTQQILAQGLTGGNGSTSSTANVNGATGGTGGRAATFDFTDGIGNLTGSLTSASTGSGGTGGVGGAGFSSSNGADTSDGGTGGTGGTGGSLQVTGATVNITGAVNYRGGTGGIGGTGGTNTSGNFANGAGGVGGLGGAGGSWLISSGTLNLSANADLRGGVGGLGGLNGGSGNGRNSDSAGAGLGGSVTLSGGTFNWTGGVINLGTGSDSAHGTFTLSGGTLVLPTVAQLDAGLTGNFVFDSGTLHVTDTAATTLNGSLRVFASLGSAPGSGLTRTVQLDGDLTQSVDTTLAAGNTLTTAGTFTLNNASLMGGGSLGAAHYQLQQDSGLAQVQVGLTDAPDGSPATLTKLGAGVLALLGGNTYTGSTTISAGTALFATLYGGDTSQWNRITVANGARIGFTWDPSVSGQDNASLNASFNALLGNAQFAGAPRLAVALPGTVNQDLDLTFTPSGAADIQITSLQSTIQFTGGHTVTLGAPAGSSLTLTPSIDADGVTGTNAGPANNPANDGGTGGSFVLNGGTTTFAAAVQIDGGAAGTSGITGGSGGNAGSFAFNGGTTTFASSLSASGGNGGGNNFTLANGHGGNGGSFVFTGGTTTFATEVHAFGGEAFAGNDSQTVGNGGNGGSFAFSGGTATFSAAVYAVGGSVNVVGTGGTGVGNGGSGGSFVFNGGTTTFASGVLAYGGSSAYGGGGDGGSLVFSGGTTTFVGAVEAYGGSASGSGGNGGNFTVSGGNVRILSDSVVFLYGGTGASHGAAGTLSLQSGTLELPTLGWLETSGNKLIGNFAFTGGTLKAADASEDTTVTGGGILGGALNAAGLTATRTLDLAGKLTLDPSVVLQGTGGLTKSGAGTLVLQGAHAYTGATTVSAGSLVNNGSLASAVTVQSGATLGGSGTFNALVTTGSGAHLAPGGSGSPMTFASGLTLGDGTKLNFALGATSDLINVTGGTLTGPVSEAGATFYFTDAGGFGAGTYDLIESTGGTLSGFDETKFALGSGIAGYHFVFAMNGNFLQVTASAIPEPATYAALFGVLAFGAAVWRRRTVGRDR